MKYKTPSTCRLVRDLVYGPSAGPEKAGQPAPAGTELNTTTAHVLVCNGDAVPADDLCAVRAYRKLWPKEPVGETLTDEQKQKLEDKNKDLIRKKAPVAAGIHPEDYDDFYAGRMTGYDPETGDPIPGPNAEYDGPIALK